MQGGTSLDNLPCPVCSGCQQDALVVDFWEALEDGGTGVVPSFLKSLKQLGGGGGPYFYFAHPRERESSIF